MLQVAYSCSKIKKLDELTRLRARNRVSPPRMSSPLLEWDLQKVWSFHSMCNSFEIGKLLQLWRINNQSWMKCTQGISYIPLTIGPLREAVYFIITNPGCTKHSLVAVNPSTIPRMILGLGMRFSSLACRLMKKACRLCQRFEITCAQINSRVSVGDPWNPGFLLPATVQLALQLQPISASWRLAYSHSSTLFCCSRTSSAGHKWCTTISSVSVRN